MRAAGFLIAGLVFAGCITESGSVNTNTPNPEPTAAAMPAALTMWGAQFYEVVERELGEDAGPTNATRINEARDELARSLSDLLSTFPPERDHVRILIIDGLQKGVSALNERLACQAAPDDTSCTSAPALFAWRDSVRAYRRAVGEPDPWEDPDSSDPTCGLGDDTGGMCFTYVVWKNDAGVDLSIRLDVDRTVTNAGDGSKTWRAGTGESSQPEEFQVWCFSGIYQGNLHLRVVMADTYGRRLREPTVTDIPCTTQADVVELTIGPDYGLSVVTRVSPTLCGWASSAERESCLT